MKFSELGETRVEVVRISRRGWLGTETKGLWKLRKHHRQTHWIQGEKNCVSQVKKSLCNEKHNSQQLTILYLHT